MYLLARHVDGFVSRNKIIKCGTQATETGRMNGLKWPDWYVLVVGKQCWTVRCLGWLRKTTHHWSLNPPDMISSPLINADSLGDIWVNDNFPEIAYRFLQFATVLWGHCLSPDITRTYPIIHPDQMTQDSSDETICLKSWEKDEKDPDIIPLNKLMHWTFPFTKKIYEKFTNTRLFVANVPFRKSNLIYQLSHFSDFSGGWSTLRRNLPDEKISGWHLWNLGETKSSPLKSYLKKPQ